MELLVAQEELIRLLQETGPAVAGKIDTRRGTPEERLRSYELRDAMRGEGTADYVQSLGPREIVKTAFLLGLMTHDQGKAAPVVDKVSEKLSRQVGNSSKTVQAAPEPVKETEPVTESEPVPEPVKEEVVQQKPTEPIKKAAKKETAEPSSKPNDLAALFGPKRADIPAKEPEPAPEPAPVPEKEKETELADPTTYNIDQIFESM